MQTGDDAGAIADFRKVLEISPGLSESLQRLGATQWRDAIKGGNDDIRRRSGRVCSISKML